MSESEDQAPAVKTSDELEGVEAEHDASAQEQPEEATQGHETEPPLSLGRLVERETEEPQGSE
jgi:hypothetical protein